VKDPRENLRLKLQKRLNYAEIPIPPLSNPSVENSMRKASKASKAFKESNPRKSYRAPPPPQFIAPPFGNKPLMQDTNWMKSLDRTSTSSTSGSKEEQTAMRNTAVEYTELSSNAVKGDAPSPRPKTPEIQRKVMEDPFDFLLP